MTENKKVRPSDDLDRSWVALKPGIYKPKQDLTPFKGKNLTRDEMLDHEQGTMSLGVGEDGGAVFIYIQGTIEVIGKVYHGRKLIKPGIYSQFEKLRYLNNEEVLPLDPYTVESKRNAWDKKIRIPNPYMRLVQTEQGNDIIQYMYVSFLDQFTEANGMQLCPVLNGRIKLYPDGSFETTGLVFKRDKNGVVLEEVDSVGYLGNLHAVDDEKHHEFDNLPPLLTRGDEEDINTCWEILAHNEDGSVTYGPKANIGTELRSLYALPKGLIPINKGWVNVSFRDGIKLYGDVVTEKGFKIIVDNLTLDELRYINQFTLDHHLNLDRNSEEYKIASRYIDLELIYVPVERNQAWLVLHPDHPETRYCYHLENEYYTVYNKDNVTYKAIPAFQSMKGVSYRNSLTIPNSVDWINELKSKTILRTLPEDELTKRYPIKLDHENLNTESTFFIFNLGFSLLPKGYIDDKNEFNYCIYIDYLTLLKGKDLIPSPLGGQSYIIGDPDISAWGWLPLALKHRKENLGRLTQTEVNNVVNKMREAARNKVILNDEFDQMFIPFRHPLELKTVTINEGYRDSGNYVKLVEIPENERNDDDPSIYKLIVKGKCIWQRRDRYYLLSEGEVFFDTTWPDIVDKNGEVDLFSIDGYFKDEPIFVYRNEEVAYHLAGNYFKSIDGIKRQEKGVFQLVARDVSAYLTEYDKRYIASLRGQFKEYKLNPETNKIEFKYGLLIDKARDNFCCYRDIDTGLILSGLGYSQNASMPWGQSPLWWLYLPKSVLTNYRNRYGNDINVFKRIVHYDYQTQRLSTTEDVYIAFTAYDREITRPYLYKLPKNISRPIDYLNTLPYNEGLIDTSTTVIEDLDTADDTTRLNSPISSGYRADNGHTVHVSPITYWLDENVYTLLVPDYQIVVSSDAFVHGYTTTRNPVRIYYKHHDELNTFSGYVHSDENGEFDIPIPIIRDVYGYTEVWVDDPFLGKPDEVYRITYKLQDKREPYDTRLTVANYERVTPKYTSLNGSGARYATITLRDESMTTLAETTTSEIGDWLLEDLSFQVGKAYTVIMQTKFGYQDQLTFVCKAKYYPPKDTVYDDGREDWWSVGELINSKQLFGLEEMPCLFNLRCYVDDMNYIHGITTLDDYRPGSNALSPQVVSSLHFNFDDQTYTIKGLCCIDGTTTMLKEGTYPIGTTPIKIENANFLKSLPYRLKPLGTNNKLIIPSKPIKADILEWMFDWYYPCGDNFITFNAKHPFTDWHDPRYMKDIMPMKYSNPIAYNEYTSTTSRGVMAQLVFRPEWQKSWLKQLELLTDEEWEKYTKPLNDLMTANHKFHFSKQEMKLIIQYPDTMLRGLFGRVSTICHRDGVSNGGILFAQGIVEIKLASGYNAYLDTTVQNSNFIKSYFNQHPDEKTSHCGFRYDEYTFNHPNCYNLITFIMSLRPEPRYKPWPYSIVDRTRRDAFAPEVNVKLRCDELGEALTEYFLADNGYDYWTYPLVNKPQKGRYQMSGMNELSYICGLFDREEVPTNLIRPNTDANRLNIEYIYNDRVYPLTVPSNFMTESQGLSRMTVEATYGLYGEMSAAYAYTHNPEMKEIDYLDDELSNNNDNFNNLSISNGYQFRLTKPDDESYNDSVVRDYTATPRPTNINQINREQFDDEIFG